VIADGEPIMRIVPQADTLLKPIVDQAYRAFRENSGRHCGKWVASARRDARNAFAIHRWIAFRRCRPRGQVHVRGPPLGAGWRGPAVSCINGRATAGHRRAIMPTCRTTYPSPS
jgi:hypothetical protein